MFWDQNGFSSALQRYVRRRQTERQLMALNDHQLKDIGLQRSQIAQISYELANRR